RTAARSADHRELVDAKIVSDGQDVAGRVGDGAIRSPRRAAVAWPVVTDQPDAKAIQHTAPRLRPAPAAGSSVQEEYRGAVRCAGDLDLDQAPFASDLPGGRG